MPAHCTGAPGAACAGDDDHLVAQGEQALAQHVPAALCRHAPPQHVSPAKHVSLHSIRVSTAHCRHAPPQHPPAVSSPAPCTTGARQAAPRRPGNLRASKPLHTAARRTPQSEAAHENARAAQPACSPPRCACAYGGRQAGEIRRRGRLAGSCSLYLTRRLLGAVSLACSIPRGAGSVA
jgi:hypothetical protein